MNKNLTEETTTRRQFLLSASPGVGSLVSLAAFAKLPKPIRPVEMDEQMLDKTNKNLSDEHFVMYF